MLTMRAGALAALAMASAVGVAASGPTPAEITGMQAFDLGVVRLGIELEEVGADAARGLGLSAPAGARVVDVSDGSPAEKAGLREGDVILVFDGEAVRSVAHLARLVRETPPGREVSLELVRDGKRQTLRVAPERTELGDLLRDHPALSGLHRPGAFAFDFDAPKMEGQPFVWRGLDERPRLGIRYQDVTGQLAGYFGVPGDRGVIVVHVEEDSPAARAGLEAGDVLLDVGGNEIGDGRDLARAVRGAPTGKPVSLRVLRRGQERTLEVQLEEPRPPEPHRRGEAI